MERVVHSGPLRRGDLSKPFGLSHGRSQFATCAGGGIGLNPAVTAAAVRGFAAVRMRHFVAPMSWCWASVRLATELIQAAMSEVSRTNRPARRYRSLKSEDLSALGLGRHMAALAAGRGRLERRCSRSMQLAFAHCWSLRTKIRHIARITGSHDRSYLSGKASGQLIPDPRGTWAEVNEGETRGSPPGR